MKLCITTFHVKSIRDFLEFPMKILYQGFPRPFLMRKPTPLAREVSPSEKVEGSPDKVFSLKMPKNPYYLSVK